MALSATSLFLYGIQVTEFNSSIDFKGAVSDVTPRLASLTIGFYSAAGLAREVKRALEEVDSLRVYTVTIDRTVMAGQENRMTVSSNGAFFQLLFATGPRSASSANSIMGFNFTDYTGATTYTGSSSVGTLLQTTRVGYNYLSPDFMRKVFGTVNISASGEKEAIVFNIQKFFQVEFRYEPKAKVIAEWVPALEWLIQQRPIDFTPEVTSPTVFYEATLERTTDDGKGLGYKMDEMLPQFSNFYKTGSLVFRQRNE
jgi:hypothetical protein